MPTNTNDWLLMQPQPGNFLLTDEDGLSREVMILKATEDKIPAGTILGKVSSTGKVVPFNPTATDGSQNPVGILYAPHNGVNLDVDVLVIARLAEVREDSIFGLTPDTRDATAAALAQLNIILR